MCPSVHCLGRVDRRQVGRADIPAIALSWPVALIADSAKSLVVGTLNIQTPMSFTES